MKALTTLGYVSVKELHDQATFWLNGLARCAPCADPKDEATRQALLTSLATEVREYEEILRQGPPAQSA